MFSFGVNKNYYTFATAKLPRCVSSAWLECLPVTQEVTGSSPVRTAERDLRVSFCFWCVQSLTLFPLEVRVLSPLCSESASRLRVPYAPQKETFGSLFCFWCVQSLTSFPCQPNTVSPSRFPHGAPPHSPLMPPSVPPWGKSGLLANKAYGTYRTYRTYMANERVFRCSPPLGRGRGWVSNMTHIGFLFGIDHAALACLRFSAGKAAGCCCCAFVLCE